MMNIPSPAALSPDHSCRKPDDQLSPFVVGEKVRTGYSRDPPYDNDDQTETDMHEV
jgi:hypothetical protein